MAYIIFDFVQRICFISLDAYGYFNEEAPAGGGAQRQFHLLSTNLTDQFDVHFIVGDYGQTQIEKREKVTLHRAYEPNPSASATERGKQLLQLQRVIRQVNADVYITRCSPQKLSVLFILLYLYQRPLIYHIAADSFVEKPVSTDIIRQQIYSHALPHLSKVVTQTSYQSEQLQQSWDTKSTVIPNGYPPADVVDLHENRDYILWVGRIIKEQKRPHLFLDLAEAIPEEEFVLVGPPTGEKSYTEKVIGRAEELSNVTYVGRVPPSEIHKYYRRAIALINTSSFEGFPNTFLEAWRYATPVVGLDIDPGRFLQFDPQTSDYASGNFEMFINIISQISSCVNKRKELGKIGMKSFTSRYHLSTVVNLYQNVIKETGDVYR